MTVSRTVSAAPHREPRLPLSPRLALPLAPLAGALLPLSFSPVGLWPAGLLSVVGLLLALQGQSPGRAALLGWLYGLGAFGLGVSWIYVSIAVYGNASPPFAAVLTAALVAALALFFALQCWLFQTWFRHLFPIVAFSALWVLFEWLRSWFLTGFPWLYLGYGHLHTPLAGLAPVFGVLGISLIAILSAGLLFQLLLPLFGAARPKRGLLPPAFGLILFWSLAGLLRGVDWVSPRDETLSVGLVQANIDQREKFDSDLLQGHLRRYERLSAPLWGSADLVIWPETAIPLLYQRAGPVLDHFGARAAVGGASLVTGILSLSDGDIHNSVMVLGDGGGMYHKQKLVPFGEYVPLEGWLAGLLEIFHLPMSSIRPGPAEQELLYAGGLGLAPYICYEVVYPDFVRETARGADLLITISNDTWFGDSWGPWQHLEMAAMRALENGRYMLRSTNNGVTAIIDHKGRVQAQAPQFVEAVVSGDVALLEGRTPFSHWGSWPIVLFCALLLQSTGLASRAARTRN